MEGNKISLGGMYKAQLWDAEADRIDAGRLVAALVSSRQALRRFVHRQKLFHGRLSENFKILAGRKPLGPLWLPRREKTFFARCRGGRAHRGGIDFIFPSGNRWRPNLDRSPIETLIWA